MPRYADRFRSHIPEGDPRSNLTGAYGCIWPTMPPHRWIIKSIDAYGALVGLNTQGAIFERITSIGEHDRPVWNLIAAPFPITTGQIQKYEETNPFGFRYEIGMAAGPCGNILVKFKRPHEKCNRDYDLEPFVCPGYYGGWGPNTKLLQVEFDKTDRHDWPPPE